MTPLIAQAISSLEKKDTDTLAAAISAFLRHIGENLAVLLPLYPQ